MCHLLNFHRIRLNYKPPGKVSQKKFINFWYLLTDPSAFSAVIVAWCRETALELSVSSKSRKNLLENGEDGF